MGAIESARGRWQETVTELKRADLELYDLERDIDESEDLRERNPDEYAAMKKELVTFFDNIR